MAVQLKSLFPSHRVSGSAPLHFCSPKPNNGFERKKAEKDLNVCVCVHVGLHLTSTKSFDIWVVMLSSLTSVSASFATLWNEIVLT